MGADAGGIIVMYLMAGLAKFALECAIFPAYGKSANESGYLAAALQVALWPFTIGDSIRRWTSKSDLHTDSRQRLFDAIIEENFADILRKMEAVITLPVQPDSFIKAISQIASTGNYYLAKDQLAQDDPKVLFLMMIINKIRYKMPSYNLTESDMNYIISKFQDLYRQVGANTAES